MRRRGRCGWSLWLAVVAACGSEGGDGSLGDAGADAPPPDPVDAAQPGVDGAISSDAPLGAGILSGSPGDPAWAAIPTIESPDIPTGKLVIGKAAYGWVGDQISVWVVADATVGAVNGLARDLDATLIAGDPRIGRLTLALSDGADLEAALTRASANSSVELATRVIVHPEPQRLAPGHTSTIAWEWTTAAAGSSWGLKHVRAPAVWNLTDALADHRDDVPRAIIAESGLQAHPDHHVASTGDLTDTAHGNGVAGALFARFNNVGVEAVFPADALATPSVALAAYDAGSDSTVRLQERLFTQLIAARIAGVPAIINLSAGNQNVKCAMFPDATFLCDQWFYDEGQGKTDMEKEGAAWLLWSQRVDAFQAWSDWLMVCSAGNDFVSAADALNPRFVGLRAYAYQAWMNSGCGYVAQKRGGESRHFIVVEALAKGGQDLWDEASPSGSAQGGTIAAPGHEVGVLTSGSGYQVATGTSFAAPMVGSTLLVLWTLAPEATHQQIRAALLSGAASAVGRSAARLDAWGAVAELADQRQLDLDLFVADLDDDSTADGNLRRNPATRAAQPFDGRPRGDGCVDLADLRAFRDAWLDAHRGPFAALDGPADHRLRDQNLDESAAFTGVDSWAAPEAWWSRADLDANGVVELVDLEVMRRAWGRCRPLSGSAETQGVVAAELERWVNSLDLWIELDGPTQITISGQESFLADPAALSARMVSGYLVHSLPLDACHADLEVRVGQGAVYRDVDLRPGADVILDADLPPGEADTAPLVYWRTGREVDEMAIDAAGADASYAAASRVESPLAAPSGQRVAGAGAGGLEIVAPGDSGGFTTTAVRVAGVTADFIPTAWSPDGSGVLGKPAFGTENAIYVDAQGLTGVKLGGSVALDTNDWPALSAGGWAYFLGLDDILYRQRVRPQSPALGEADLLAFLDGAGTCQEGSLPAPEKLRTFTGGGLDLAHAVPGSMSARGQLLVKQAAGGGKANLMLVSGDGTAAQTLVTGWTERGGVEFLDFWHSDGLSWLPDGSGFLMVDTTGTWLVRWTVPGIPTATQVTKTLLGPATGAIAVSPAGTHYLQQEVSGPPQDRTSTLTVRTLAGATVQTLPWARPEWGRPSWSSDGKHLAYVKAEVRLKPDIHVVGVGGGEVWNSSGFTSANGSQTNEQQISWGLDLWGY